MGMSRLHRAARVGLLGLLAACSTPTNTPSAPATMIPQGYGGLVDTGGVGAGTDSGATGQDSGAATQPDAGGATTADAGPPKTDGTGGQQGAIDAGAGGGEDTAGAGGEDAASTGGGDAGGQPVDAGGQGGGDPKCVDLDKDGYGQGCAAGADCDDTNPNFALVCPDCTKAHYPGCACKSVAANCYSGDPAWVGKGVCQAGVQLCKNGFWGECNGEVLPSPEVCDAQDNNCNGLKDEGVLSSCGTCDVSCTKQQLGPDYGVPFDPSPDSSNGVGIDAQGYVVLDKSKANIDLNHIWVANSSEASVSKIDTKTGFEVGRYKICSNPSRTSVDLKGDVWVGCRGDGGVAKILTDKTKCVDKNGNGKIDTSADLNGDHSIQPNEMVANDECIQFIVFHDGSTIARAAGVDKDNHAWIGFWSSKHLRRFEPKAGQSEPAITIPCSPYGLVIDQKGIIWVQGAGCGLVRVDPATKAVTKHSPPFSYAAYGINVDMFGKIWFGGGWGAARYDPVTSAWFKASGVASSSAVATGMDGYTYVVNDGPSTVTKINSVTGTVEGTISLGSGRGPHGVALDFDGYVWAVNLSKSTVSKCDPKKLSVVHESATGKSPYTYSDMTGYTLNNFTAPKGHYTNLFGVSTWGGQVAEAKSTTVWEYIDADVETPAGAYVKVRYRAGETLTGVKAATWSKELGPFPPATFPIDLTKVGKIEGRYLQVEVFLQAAQATKLSPKLKALSAKGKHVFVQ